MINVAALEKSHDRFLRANDRMLQDGAEFSAQHANDFIQKYPGFKPRTENLQKKTTAKVVRLANGRLVRIKSNVKYANAIDSGARPHVIVPRKAKMLVFRAKSGHLVFTRRVNHPGNKPYKYGWRAAWSAHRVMGQFLESEMSRISRTRF